MKIERNVELPRKIEKFSCSVRGTRKQIAREMEG